MIYHGEGRKEVKSKKEEFKKNVTTEIVREVTIHMVRNLIAFRVKNNKLKKKR